MKLYKAMPVIYTDSLPKHVGGRCHGFFTFIAKSMKDDEGIHAHEWEHFKQYWMLLFFGHVLLYRFSKKYRFWAEAKALAKQLSFSTERIRDLNYYSRELSTRYGIGCTIEEARKAIESHA